MRPLTRREELADIEFQVADAHRAERDEWRSAALFDRTEYVRVGGQWMDADRVPDLADVADLDERRRA
jgi:hypothetical protein